MEEMSEMGFGGFASTAGAAVSDNRTGAARGGTRRSEEGEEGSSSS